MWDAFIEMQIDVQSSHPCDCNNCTHNFPLLPAQPARGWKSLLPPSKWQWNTHTYIRKNTQLMLTGCVCLKMRESKRQRDAIYKLLSVCVSVWPQAIRSIRFPHPSSTLWYILLCVWKVFPRMKQKKREGLRIISAEAVATKQGKKREKEKCIIQLTMVLALM